MRNFNETTITDAVLERIKDATDPRIKEVSEALVHHLHAFVREVRPTQASHASVCSEVASTCETCDIAQRDAR